MKKFGALLAALIMLMAAACASAETAPDLVDLYDASDSGKVWLGTAIPILEGVLVASEAVLPDEPKSLEAWDGTSFRNVTMVLSTAGGKVLVMLLDPEGETLALPPYSFADTGKALNPDELVVRSGDWMRSRINRAVYDAVPIAWQDLDCMVLTLSGDTEPGALLQTVDGKLAGMIAAEYAEGIHRYIALTADQITGCIYEAAELLDDSEAETEPLEGYKVTADRNIVTFDWSAAELPEIPEGFTLYHIVADTESSYLNFSQVLKDETSVTMLLTPGRMYESGLEVFADGNTPDRLPEKMARIKLPEAEPVTEHSFRSIAFAIAETPKNGSDPVPAEEITEELLRSGNACIWSVTSYSVEETMPTTDMLITLTAPDGNNYRYESGWYYDSNVQGNDAWYVSLNETGLLELLNQNGYPAGIYEVSMYIEGKLADSFSFTLIK